MSTTIERDLAIFSISASFICFRIRWKDNNWPRTSCLLIIQYYSFRRDNQHEKASSTILFTFMILAANRRTVRSYSLCHEVAVNFQGHDSGARVGTQSGKRMPRQTLLK